LIRLQYHRDAEPSGSHRQVTKAMNASSCWNVILRLGTSRFTHCLDRQKSRRFSGLARQAGSPAPFFHPPDSLDEADRRVVIKPAIGRPTLDREVLPSPLDTGAPHQDMPYQ
jgi:hypothetical protein